MTIKNLSLLIALALAGCATNPGAHQVGTSSVINGVEVWTGGPPSRPYQVIATVQRLAADSSTSFLQQEGSIADEAVARGADSVIVLDAVMVVSRMSLVDARPIMAPKVDAQLIKWIEYQ